jgi:type II secretory pathway pseudopilin PulG
MLDRRLPRQRGATLLEALGYLTVAALITAGVLTLFGPSFTSAQGTRLANEVASLANNVRDVYASENSYSNVSIAALAQASAVPPTLKISRSGATATVSDTWGGAVTLNPVGTGASVQVQYGAVPSDICRRVLVSGGGWTDITVNNNDLGTGSPDLNQAYSACNNAAGNTIAWTFQ